MLIFGLFLTLGLFLFFNKLKNLSFINATKNPNSKFGVFIKKTPTILTAGITIILILEIFKIDYQTYYTSAGILSFFIAPATIALAYPMYKNRHVLIKNKRAIYPALFLGAISAVISTYFLTKLFHAQPEVIMSLIPKSTTMPIALEISKTLGGYSELTAVVVALTGVFGGVAGHGILKFLKIRSDVAIGLALGSASHVIGTASCADKQKPIQITASTIALILVGLISVIICKIFKIFIQ